MVVEIKAIDKVGQNAVHQVRRYLSALGSMSGVIVNLNSKDSKVEMHTVTEEACTQIA